LRAELTEIHRNLQANAHMVSPVARTVAPPRLSIMGFPSAICVAE
jgi:hypothetical protein